MSRHLPEALPGILLKWYDQNARALPWRRDTDPYHVWLSEIMLQQTGALVVKDYYARFLASFPTVEALAVADEQQVLKLWEGLGYYSRARNLMKTAQMLVKDCGGHFPDTHEGLARLPGVGPYTAGAIASICFNVAVPAVDGNVVRVITRVAGIGDEVTDAIKKDITSALAAVYPPDRCGDFTQSLMELGATVCIPNAAPRCSNCPVSNFCVAFRDGTAMSLPVKKKKQPKKQRALTVFVLTCGEHTALRRRDDSGLLAGLWELPNVEGKLAEHEAVAVASQWGAKPVSLLKCIQRDHVFTHIKWDMICYYIDCAAEPDCFTWVSRDRLSDTYALPTAFRKFVDV